MSPPLLATLTDTKGIIALAAAAVAVIALLCCLALMLSLRRLRRAQRLVLGEQGQEDVVAHAARLHEAFEALRAYVDDVAVRLDARLGGVENTLHRTIAHRSLIRYDAYNELSGHQSVSIALLDDERSGVVLSCDPSSRSGARLRQAGHGRPGRTRALAGGGRSGACRARRRLEWSAGR